MPKQMHSKFCRDAKKFSPKEHRKRVGAMSGRPCPLHDGGKKRPCKQAVNPLDICAKFNSNEQVRRRYLSSVVQPARSARRALTPGDLVLDCTRRLSKAPMPPPPPPPRHDGTDHLPAQPGIDYGSVGGTSTSSAVQTTLDGGVIRPPSAAALPPAAAPEPAGDSSSSSAAAGPSTAAPPPPSAAQREAADRWCCYAC